MKILYLCHRIPYPPDKGDKIRAFHQVRALAQRHEVDLFTLADDPADQRHGPVLRRYCRRVTVSPLLRRAAQLRAMAHCFTRTPFTLPYFYSRELAQAIRQALVSRSYDRIFVYSSAMAQYVDRRNAIPIVTDLVDVDSNKWMQYSRHTRFPLSAVYKSEAGRLRDFERHVCERSACVIVTTGREAQLVRGISMDVPVHVIPNGVDTEYFQPPAVQPDVGPPAIGFTGDMGYFPNEEAVTYFAQAVLPLIHRSLPRARFLIIGRNPSRKVLKLGERAGVEVTGFVPDVRPYLARIRVSVAPFSIAAGIQNKILEAMAYGLPVVGTSRAVQGLSPLAAEAVETADSPEKMAAAVVRLLEDPQLARSKGMECRRRVTEDYQWDASGDRLLQVLENPSCVDTHRTEVASPHA